MEDIHIYFSQLKENEDEKNVEETNKHTHTQVNEK